VVRTRNFSVGTSDRFGTRTREAGAPRREREEVVMEIEASREEGGEEGEGEGEEVGVGSRA
jgi:hypothetical protein